MASDTYIHGTEPSEQERLAALNRMTNAAFVHEAVRNKCELLIVCGALNLQHHGPHNRRVCEGALF